MTALPIVGAHYRPPAKALLSVLPHGTALRAVPEPTNEHDPNAIAVWLDSTAIPHTHAEALRAALVGYGFTLEDVLGQSSWHLGYIPAKAAVFIAPTLHGDERPGTLAFGLAGKPQIEMALDPTIAHLFE